jgi:hypothetical protein
MRSGRIIALGGGCGTVAVLVVARWRKDTAGCCRYGTCSYLGDTLRTSAAGNRAGKAHIIKQAAGLTMFGLEVPLRVSVHACTQPPTGISRRSLACMQRNIFTSHYKQ